MESRVESIGTTINVQVMAAPHPSIRCQFGTRTTFPSIDVKSLRVTPAREYSQHQAATRIILTFIKK